MMSIPEVDTPDNMEGQVERRKRKPATMSDSDCSMMDRTLLSTMPTKRLVLDVETNSQQIMSRIALRNKSRFDVAFKGECNGEGLYILDPDCGVLTPGETTYMTVWMKEFHRTEFEVQQDRFQLHVAKYTPGLYPSLDQFFENCTFAESHQMRCSTTPASAQRMDEMKEQEKLDYLAEEARLWMKRWVGGAIVCLSAFALLYVLFVDMCQPCQADRDAEAALFARAQAAAKASQSWF